MKFSRSQQGASMFGGLAFAALLAFAVIMAFKLVPHYLDNKAISKIIHAVERDTATGQRINSPADFYTHISKGLQVNSISDFNLREAIEITQEHTTYIVRVNYERRESVIKNIDLVMTFNDEYRVRSR